MKDCSVLRTDSSSANVECVRLQINKLQQLGTIEDFEPSWTASAWPGVPWFPAQGKLENSVLASVLVSVLVSVLASALLCLINLIS